MDLNYVGPITLEHFHRTISTSEDNGKIEVFAQITINREKDQ